MDLTVSSAYSRPAHSVSFGMAKFSDEGLRLAQSLSDVYEPLGTPTEYQEPKFFTKKKALRKAPFAKYLESKTGRKASDDDVEEAARTIVACGTSNNSYANGMFVRQLLTTRPYVSKLPEYKQETISKAVEEVFKVNWNNPALTKKETLDLLEMAKDSIEDNQYVSLTGVIENCNKK